MRTKRLFRAIGDVDDDLIEEAQQARARPKLRLALQLSAAAAAVALVIGLGVQQRNQPLIEQQPQIARIAAPAGPRKILNWNGYRYAFLGDGTAYDLADFDPSVVLGTLDTDMLAGGEADSGGDAGRDGATTWALGGTVYELPGYDPGYRLAVEQDGLWYLAELVALANDAPLDAGYYFSMAGLGDMVKGADILPHSGGESLHSFRKRDAKAMVDLLATAENAALTNEQYESLARAQAEGRSWQLSLRLADGTTMTMYIVPEMALISIGDGYYHLPNRFLERFHSAFDGLPQQMLPAH